MSKQPRTNFVTCTKCNEDYFPYGDRSLIPPASDWVTCPNCGNRQQVVWDEDLQKEVARKNLGLDKESNSESTLNTVTMTELKYEISSIKAKLEDLIEQISDLKNTVDAVIPETQELIKNVITEILMEKEKSKKSGLNPV